jgi:hypothetical protein
MRRVLMAISILCLLATALPAGTEPTPAKTAMTGRVIKVLPHFLDLKGRHTLSPSLYDRDAYQAQLRAQPEQRSGIRYDVQWKAKVPGDAKLTLRVEMRSDARGKTPVLKTLEKEVKPRGFSRWTSIPFTGDDYKKFGDVTAWRVTLWNGDKLIGEQKSFLW